ncbi:glycosyltransferase family 4 protein [Ensifer soli]|uniref:glycosyltransferase family 4 protein n=1 Tax=Ciceribacter sp. sgz301302 TaxID=3342379 RepID=UPI0035B9DC44
MVMAPVPIATGRVIFDISRLYRCRHNAFATGVDRIDLAIALDLVARFGDACDFVHAGLHGWCMLPRAASVALLRRMDAAWTTGTARPAARRRSGLVAFLGHAARARLGKRPDAAALSDTTYVVASHSGLGRLRGGLRSLDPSGRMRRLVYIHDLIPIEYPEYQRPQTQAQFTAYLDEVTERPLVVVANSHDTARRFAAFAARKAIALDGIEVIIPDLVAGAVAAAPPRAEVRALAEGGRPYFITIGTIEPRKNHLLLLNIWRELARAGEPPYLVIVGKRGWENENVVDMLDRCEALRGCVREMPGLADHEVQVLLKGARALLFPSFTEGLGIPVLEARALGVDCILSDIPVFREIAGDGTVLVDPLDGPGWIRAIRAALT